MKSKPMRETFDMITETVVVTKGFKSSYLLTGTAAEVKVTRHGSCSTAFAVNLSVIPTRYFRATDLRETAAHLLEVANCLDAEEKGAR